MGEFKVLAGLRVQVTGGRKVCAGAAGRPDVQVSEPAGIKRAGRPELVTGALQDADSPAEIFESGPVPAEEPQHRAAAVQHSPQRYAAGKRDGTIEGGEPGRRPARVDERRAQ